MSFYREHRGRSRTILVLLVLIAFVSLQSAAAIVEHPHNHSKNHPHCCAACHAGHLGVLQAGADLGLAPPAAPESRLRPQEYCASFEYLVIPSPSRAPPA